jgi:hypothetical protein
MVVGIVCFVAGFFAALALVLAVCVGAASLSEPSFASRENRFKKY